jgi:phosphoribosylformimino-5-aminoimidazole carboxamide ribotide isomerase
LDLKDGRCVRLTQGRAEDVKVYSEDPVAMAVHWVEHGARILHIVDLDGAFQGRPVHAPVIRRIAEAVAVPVEVGGGLRTDKDIEDVLAAGAARAIIGTRAFADPDSMRSLAGRFGGKLVVGIDARDGKVQVKGWVETTQLDALELAAVAEQAGVSTLIYTDTAVDGMLQGVNAEAVDRLCRRVSCNVIAAGGISTGADVKALKALRHTHLAGAIVGKALYEGSVTLEELQNAE